MTVVHPKIHVSKMGKRYFVIHGRKICFNDKLTKAEISAIYKLLLRKMRKVNRKPKSHRNQSTVITQYINTEKPRRQRRNATKSKPFLSTINELTRATASGSTAHPKDSGDKDLINKLLNENNQLKLTHNHPPNPQTQLILANNP